jgi:NADH-quinone oxidoreductase subunit M
MVAGGIGTVLTAGYFLWMLQRVNLGKLPDRWRGADFGDIETVEWLAWVPMLVLIVVLGVYPRLVFGVTTEAVDRLVAMISAAVG